MIIKDNEHLLLQLMQSQGQYYSFYDLLQRVCSQRSVTVRMFQDNSVHSFVNETKYNKYLKHSIESITSKHVNFLTLIVGNLKYSWSSLLVLLRRVGGTKLNHVHNPVNNIAVRFYSSKGVCHINRKHILFHSLLLFAEFFIAKQNATSEIWEYTAFCPRRVMERIDI